MKIKLKVNKFIELQEKMGITDSELARKMGVSRSTLWRAKLPETDPRFCYPGENFISSALNVFEGKTFDDLFFLDKVCS